MAKKNKTVNVKVKVAAKAQPKRKTAQRKSKPRKQTLFERKVFPRKTPARRDAENIITRSAIIGRKWGKLLADPFDNRPIRLGGTNLPTALATGFLRNTLINTVASGGTNYGNMILLFNLNNNTNAAYSPTTNCHPPVQICWPKTPGEAPYVNGSWDFWNGDTNGTQDATHYPTGEITVPGVKYQWVNQNAINNLGTLAKCLAGGVRVKFLVPATTSPPILYAGVCSYGNSTSLPYTQSTNALIQMPQTRMFPGVEAGVRWFPATDTSEGFASITNVAYQNVQSDIMCYIVATNVPSNCTMIIEAVGHFEIEQTLETAANVIAFSNTSGVTKTISQEVFCEAENYFNGAPELASLGAAAAAHYVGNKILNFANPMVPGAGGYRLPPGHERNMPMVRERKEDPVFEPPADDNDPRVPVPDDGYESFSLTSRPGSPEVRTVSKSMYDSILRRAQQLKL